MSSTLRKLRWSIQNRGLARTLQAAAKSLGRHLRPQPQIQTHPFDLEHGTDTGGLISGGDLAIGHPSDRFIEGYAAVPPCRFHKMLARGRSVVRLTLSDSTPSSISVAAKAEHSFSHLNWTSAKLWESN